MVAAGALDVYTIRPVTECMMYVDYFLLRYGLIIPKSKQQQVAKKPALVKKSVFGNHDSSDEEVSIGHLCTVLLWATGPHRTPVGVRLRLLQLEFRLGPPWFKAYTTFSRI